MPTSTALTMSAILSEKMNGLPPRVSEDADGSGQSLDDESSQSSAVISNHIDDDADDDDIEHNESELGGQSTSTGSMGREMSAIEAMAREDTTLLRRWRIAVTVIILLTCAAVSTGAVVFLRKEEKEENYEDYRLFATAVGEALRRKTEEYTIAMENMAETITATTRYGKHFPFIAMSSFEVLGRQTRALTKNDVISWVPLVTEDQRNEWSNFTHMEQGWYKESALILQTDSKHVNDTFLFDAELFRSDIWEESSGGTEAPHGLPPSVLAPLWESSPPPFSISSCNYNVLDDDEINATVYDVFRFQDAVVGKVKLKLDNLLKQFLDPDDLSKFAHTDYSTSEGDIVYERPHSIHVQPVFLNLNDRESEIVGFLVSILTWDHFMADLLHEEVVGIVAVLENSCDQAYTYEIHGDSTVYIGEGDRHDPATNGSQIKVPVNLYMNPETFNTTGHCVYSLSLYKSKEFEAGESALSMIFISIISISIAFTVMGLTFFMYDRFVRQRNAKIVYVAARSNAIISSMFPTEIRDQLFSDQDEKYTKKVGNGKKKRRGALNTANEQISNEEKEALYTEKPIADLFLHTTILFADIAGFTAWSSVREPSQVFVLLETIFQAFDDIARKRRVFKVESVGDCYVAVAGLPQPRPDHAVVMARFAHNCMEKMHSLAKKLELTLGPETSCLSMRMGLHSGPVTAGVIRGDRSRFQLFGDTMNTASRMEQTGIRGKIQVSQETADLLVAAGKVGWISSRDDVVSVKGKGEMQTCWLNVSASRGHSNSVSDATTSAESADMDCDILEGKIDVATSKFLDAKTYRLVQWNAEVLLRQMKNIVVHRDAHLISCDNDPPMEERYKHNDGTCCLDEVKEIITLPGFLEANQEVNLYDATVDGKVADQLKSYLSRIAILYRSNPFHNFEHASHVAMSVGKLLSRIVAPQNLDDKTGDIASTLHDHTYGITSDPLTQFACTLSALIHDVDHFGVPNAQLVKEECQLAKQYKNKSPAEQNSVDLAWNLLMDDEYKDLRAVIYQTDAELIRFRQLVVNSVMATDIADRELKVLRNLRWDHAFSATIVDASQHDTVNRKATIVIEHLIQASDVAHTMQHWHVYRQWNERFFLECYEAYKNGRAEKNPADGWYEGEIGFFDYYIIPLAKKLKDCGVFGVSSDEYLNYAVRNRKEWEARGREVVAEMMETVKTKYEGDHKFIHGEMLTIPPTPGKFMTKKVKSTLTDQNPSSVPLLHKCL